MRQTLWISMLAAVMVAAAATPRARAGDADVVAKARELIAANNARGAADALEDALVDAPPDQLAAIVDLLKESYAKLIQEAKAAGNNRLAEQLAEDLAILGADPAPATPTPSPTPTPEAKPEPEPKAAEAAPAVVVPRAPEPPAAAAAPVSPEAKPEPEAEPKAQAEPKAVDPAAPLELPPLSGPADKQAPPAPEAKVEESAVESIPPLETTAPPPRDASTAPATTTTAIPAPAPQTETRIPAPDPSIAELAEADALFTRKSYEEAGELYASLAARNRLPAERRKVWAYCRWAAVVARINAHPRSAEEWDAIEAEIDAVQRLVPGNWYGEYLKDRVSAARKGERHANRGRGGGLIIRGNTPEETTEATQPARPLRRPLVDDQTRRAGAEETLILPTPNNAPTEPPRAQAQAQVQAQAPAPIPAPTAAAAASGPIEWQVLETTNFRVFHVDPALAEKAAEAAEAARISQGAHWGSRAVRGAWTPRCDLYLYPTPADFARMTGQPETSPGFSTMGISGDQVTTRRVNLRADHPQLLAAILPHEVAHVVLADVFTDQQIPRWADEGMAVLAEPPAEQAGRAAELNAPLAQNRVFKLDQLMNIDYPGADQWSLYYAQSVSLTKFLVHQGTPNQFIAFLKQAQRQGPEVALREVYQIEGFSDLETRWRTFAERQAAQIASADGATQR